MRKISLVIVLNSLIACGVTDDTATLPETCHIQPGTWEVRGYLAGPNCGFDRDDTLGHRTIIVTGDGATCESWFGDSHRYYGLLAVLREKYPDCDISCSGAVTGSPFFDWTVEESCELRPTPTCKVKACTLTAYGSISYPLGDW